ncbi:hypothetical protein ACFYXF_34425 [Streptomyces sp. NPDC002680]|uniref:hypothetical protein n=1 Tax=Streptomyces sp. NPDC002680 TaxID=3364659 RepID=UPI00367D157A
MSVADQPLAAYSASMPFAEAPEVTFSLVEVTLTLQGTQLLLEVSDPDKEKTPAPRTAGQHDEDGRGLAVIAALTNQWGYDLRRYTKCAWATFPLPAVTPACSA